MAESGQAQPIEIRVDEVSQLFNTLDPLPFHERDLDSDAEEYIVGWAREIAHQGELSIACTCRPARPAATWPRGCRRRSLAFSRTAPTCSGAI
jgi:hypothetical protein